jgi:uncharacterized membrane protein
MRTFLLWLHILGAATWFGVNIAQTVIGPRLMKDARAGQAWMQAVEKASGPVYGAAAVLIGVTGVVLVLTNAAYSFASAFVGIGIGVLIIGGALAGMVFNRRTRQIITLYEKGEAAGVPAVYRSILPWAVVDTSLIAFVVLAMVGKWGA